MVRNFGVWLRDKRNFLGLKQKDLASILGVSAKTISHYENGRNNAPNQKELESVIRAMVKEKEYQDKKRFDKTVNDFFEELSFFDEEESTEEKSKEKDVRYFTKEEFAQLHVIYQELFSFLLHGGLTKEQRKTLFVLLDKQFDLLKKYDFEG